ncbi:MAG: LPS export ABC transporter periplasmic protein LptC [Spirochaetes bacterium GWD1_61_31]|nr:MAG: LPS export ABC transporter periplasmic protein LptC [Spirochaetes bacterium GWB1_60_80]OHD31369.1 MAG: LPS export ABC transporter periplasmic protein LptC [Spirochaetes bacterium GWC1_61_12]OHD39987.1 MAG: LPS export ABC transporter periplasmic protein LptC [Spirochaetes bacterium GWD1_61_31]OHD42359.1 MAG: LPS export ABC transporter periplasmic protein LptC [Spirochaetes bacterium GWE1_60_18]OHD60531.1 MAG: LPS export ABC transporter periplasmic protein LptC [Spirochaetes bacterium GWF
MVSLLLAACSLDYGSLDDDASTLPDTIVFDFRHTVVRNGRILYKLEAEKAEKWEKEGRFAMEGVTFTEYDPHDGHIVANGHADRGSFYVETESADLSGNVFFAAPGDDITVTTGNLSWNGENRTLSSQLDTITTLSDGASSLSGAGFAADARTRSFIFQETVNGRFVPDSAAPDAAAPELSEVVAPEAATNEAPADEQTITEASTLEQDDATTDTAAPSPALNPVASPANPPATSPSIRPNTSPTDQQGSAQ